MDALTSPQHYHDDAVFQAEKKTVFYDTWQFVGFTADVANHQDFFTRMIGDTRIVIQNFHGTLKAFRNVCSHRYSQIQDETVGCGNRPLRCPYHGWSYDENGIPVGIPRMDRSDFTHVDRQSLALKQFALEICGTLIFVRLSDKGSSLTEYLGSLYPEVATLSQALDVCLDQYECTVNANWKLIVENSLEGYHINFIHDQSIKKFIPLEMTAEKPQPVSTHVETSDEKPHEKPHKFSFGYPHSWLVETTSDQAFSQWQKIEPAFATRPFKTDTYHQFHVFPNLNLATFYGSAFFIQTFHPLSGHQTQVTHYSFRTRLVDPPKKDAALAHMATVSMVDEGKTILNEDILICEMVQRGVEQDPNIGVLCKEEERVYQYQKAYLAHLTGQQTVLECALK